MIVTKALKVVTIDAGSKMILDGLIDILTSTPSNFNASNTAELKFIPF